ncbi:Apg6 BARA domain [Phytophthora infestans]|uniref:Apg6 BARA domain n=1 Tax=Phytophthora infestans TaxID=4787 RepID=A0A833T8W1_PHYIN|nr:Apg6 BARA domain [Phytophthora infestans]KAF4129410.1 Apg6 BARA domain [Phytophthora infestans]
MRRCQQCRRSLESELLSAPVLGESYVLLPTASASQSMLLLQKLPATSATPPEMGESGAFGEDLYASARYNLSLQQQHQQEQRRQQAQRRHKLKQRQRRQQQRMKDSFTASGRYFEAHVGHTSLDEENAELEDSMVAVPTYADLSHHVQLLTTQQAHCAGLPVTTPVCKECMDGMVTMIDGQAERARYEKRCFTSYLHNTTNTTIHSEDIEHIDDKIRFYENELNALEESLELMESEREAIAQQQEAMHEEEKALIYEEAGLWGQFNGLQLQETVFQEIRDAGTAQIDAMERKVASAKHLNILTDMFVIGYDGAFGTINQFRMGQSAGSTLEWNEINAAFGECALLLQTLANMIGLEFPDFRIVPLGSFSKVIRTSNLRMEYSLHGSDQQNFAESHFNLGLGAWITCLGQLMAFVRARDPSIRLPYKVAKHSIGGYSVLFLKNKQKEWTKALKYALTNLKWLLTWVSARGYSISSSSVVTTTPSKAALAFAANPPVMRTTDGSKQSVVIMEHFS